MSEDGLRNDVTYLAGALPHRGSNTEHERTAAHYIAQRLKESTPDLELDEFYSIETYGYLFASFYAEFLIVALLGLWIPWLALSYGTVVFVLYLAEFTGYPVVSRLLPQFESQNVVARLLGKRPACLLIVSAHYDTAKTTALADPRVTPWLRRFHLLLVICMVAILAACAALAVDSSDEGTRLALTWLQWPAVAVLLLAAGILVYCELTGEHVRGAVNNASGAAALVDLAERLTQTPIENADVWLVATGSKESWLSGMRHFVSRHRLDRETTFFVNLDHVGAGSLHYEVSEGLLHVFRSAPELVQAAQKVGADMGARPYAHRTLPSDLLIPLTRGYKALGIVGVDEDGQPPYWADEQDTLARISYPALLQAAAFAEGVLREIARTHEQIETGP